MGASLHLDHSSMPYCFLTPLAFTQTRTDTIANTDIVHGIKAGNLYTNHNLFPGHAVPFLPTHLRFIHARPGNLALCGLTLQTRRYLLGAPVVRHHPCLPQVQMETRERASSALMEHDTRAHGRSLLLSSQ